MQCRKGEEQNLFAGMARASKAARSVSLDFPMKLILERLVKE